MPGRKRRKPYNPTLRTKKHHDSRILLDSFSARNIHDAIQYRDKFLRYHWDYYQNLAFQRDQFSEQIKTAIFQAHEGPFNLKRWRRIVRYKYSMEPLSVQGSMTDPGGRFNLGEIHPNNFIPFPALYLASDRATGLQEALSQDVNRENENHAFDSALANPASFSDVSVSGTLETVINLSNPERLEPLIKIIRTFTVPPHLCIAAKELGFQEPKLVRDTETLIQALLAPNWREWPMQFDVPSTSQIFGRIVEQSGIAGIVYPSKFTHLDCLAAFPQNFEGNSLLELDDEAPKDVKLRRLDQNTWAQINS